jgi:hypothetical protein
MAKYVQKGEISSINTCLSSCYFLLFLINLFTILAFPPGVKRGRGVTLTTDHSPPSSAEVKYE